MQSTCLPVVGNPAVDGKAWKKECLPENPCGGCWRPLEPSKAAGALEESGRKGTLAGSGSRKGACFLPCTAVREQGFEAPAMRMRKSVGLQDGKFAFPDWKQLWAFDSAERQKVWHLAGVRGYSR